ncbi:MAG: hypothetical protein LBE21_00565 [Pseudomonadales bacterium]|jgi:hypothetical protein|nr:hypothetical protein [Pseudomonadales bacterium]
MNNWFDWYCKKLGEQKDGAMYRGRYLCPCCFMPTLFERRNFGICVLCSWEDDGQDSDDASEVRGGPNRDYSLAEARANFAVHLTMYRPNDKHAFECGTANKEARSALHASFGRAIESNEKSDWLAALKLEKAFKRMSIASFNS